VFWIISGYVSKETHMPNSTELVHRAIDLSDAEDYRGAVNLLTQAISADSSNAQAYFERGMALLNLDQGANAIADFDRALTIESEFPGARDWRARTLASLGDHQRAAHLCEVRQRRQCVKPGSLEDDDVHEPRLYPRARAGG